jgi:hypothetical protein
LPTQLPICAGKSLKGTGSVMGVLTARFKPDAKTRYVTPEKIKSRVAKIHTNNPDILPVRTRQEHKIFARLTKYLCQVEYIIWYSTKVVPLKRVILFNNNHSEIKYTNILLPEVTSWMSYYYIPNRLLGKCLFHVKTKIEKKYN